ncbi:MAG: hypothetical protein IPK67_15710 [Planctomycetes bacterium]|jgi:hypothetical protein|nr:hypothetical protein [Planctomycetota bacterium]
MRTVVLTLGLCALSACGGRSVPAPADAAARVELVTAADLEKRVADRNGRPLLLNFWAIW